jgi:hypothetical protein
VSTKISLLIFPGREKPNSDHKLLADVRLDRPPFKMEHFRFRRHQSGANPVLQSVETRRHSLQQVSIIFPSQITLEMRTLNHKILCLSLHEIILALFVEC